MRSPAVPSVRIRSLPDLAKATLARVRLAPSFKVLVPPVPMMVTLPSPPA